MIITHWGASEAIAKIFTLVAGVRPAMSTARDLTLCTLISWGNDAVSSRG